MLLRILISLLRFRGRFRRHQSLQPAEIRTLVLVELTRLGDVITMLPALKQIQGHYSSANVWLLVNDRYASFLRNIDLPCEVVGIRRPETTLGFLKAVTFLRQMRAGLVLSMSPPKRNAAVVLAGGAPRNVGYLTHLHSLTPYLQSTPVEAFGCTLTRREFYGMENIEERSIKVCRSLGIISENVHPRIHLDASTLERTWNTLRAEQRLPRGKFVVLHPFSGWEFRSWSIERFNQLAQKILLLLQHEVVFLCEKNEEGLLETSKVRFAERDDVYFLPSDDLMSTSAVLRRAALLVCNDSGPLHLASALGVRIVGLFGPAPPQLTAARNAEGVFHYERVECSPCDQCKCTRPTDSCMTLISPEYVFESVKKILSRESAVETVSNA